MASRDYKELIPAMWPLYLAFEREMLKKGIPWICTCTYRSQEEQNALYAQGRTKPGRVVTKTLKSKHTERKAFDIAIVDAIGRPVWAEGMYRVAGPIGTEVGLTWGGDWDSDGSSSDERWVDLPHFQMKE